MTAMMTITLAMTKTKMVTIETSDESRDTSVESNHIVAENENRRFLVPSKDKDKFLGGRGRGFCFDLKRSK